MILIRTQRQREYHAATRHGYTQEIVQAGLDDIEALRKVLEDALDIGATFISWNVISREAPYGRGGFESLDHAVNTVLLRLSGLKSALTTDSDMVLLPEQRETRDMIVCAFLDRVKIAHVDSTKH